MTCASLVYLTIKCPGARSLKAPRVFSEGKRYVLSLLLCYLSRSAWKCKMISQGMQRWTSHDRGELPRENGGKCERSQCITERAEEWVLPLTDPAE